ncbi:MAG: hypothetical protein AAGE52_40855, partial [Myxococcota bacterium]
MRRLVWMALLGASMSVGLRATAQSGEVEATTAADESNAGNSDTASEDTASEDTASEDTASEDTA